MPLTEDRQLQITRDGTALWKIFLETYPGTYKSSSLYSGGGASTRDVNKALVEFCSLCAQILIGSESGCEIALEDLAFLRQPTLNNRPISWLWCSRSEGTPRMRIFFDRQCLLSQVADGMGKWVRCQAILHEVGHFRHFDELFPQDRENPFSAEAEARHEAEAWWFSFVIAGICAAECACEKKLPHPDGNPTLPPIWKLIQHL